MTEKTITIEYARQRLGIKGMKMTNKQIESLLSMLRQISNKTIDTVIEKNGDNN